MHRIGIQAVGLSHILTGVLATPGSGDDGPQLGQVVSHSRTGAYLQETGVEQRAGFPARRIILSDAAP